MKIGVEILVSGNGNQQLAKFNKTLNLTDTAAKKLGRSMQRTTTQAARGAKLATKQQRNWRMELVQSNRQLYTAAALVGWFVGFIKGSWSLAMESAKKHSIDKAFFGEHGIEGGKKLLSAIHAFTKGTVSDMATMRASNLAMKLGIQKDNIPRLFGIARAAANALGVETEKMVEDVMRALGRQSTKVLDNLGVVLKQNEAYEEYAKTVGKSVKSLSAQEKRLAFQTIALQKLQEAYKKFDYSLLTSSDKMNIIGASLENLRTSYGFLLTEAIAPLHKGFTYLADKAKAFMKIFQDTGDKGFKYFTSSLFYLVTGLTAVLTPLSIFALVTSTLGISMMGLAKAGVIFYSVWRGIKGETEGTVGTLQKVGYFLQAILQMVTTFNGETSDLDVETFEKLGGATSSLMNWAVKLTQTILVLKEVVSGFADGIKDWFGIMGGVIRGLIGTVKELLGMFGIASNKTDKLKSSTMLAVREFADFFGVFGGAALTFGAFKKGKGLFGKKKPTGTAADPMYVIDMSGGGLGGGKGISSWLQSRYGRGGKLGFFNNVMGGMGNAMAQANKPMSWAGMTGKGLGAGAMLGSVMIAGVSLVAAATMGYAIGKAIDEYTGITKKLWSEEGFLGVSFGSKAEKEKSATRLQLSTREFETGHGLMGDTKFIQKRRIDRVEDLLGEVALTMEANARLVELLVDGISEAELPLVADALKMSKHQQLLRSLKRTPSPEKNTDISTEGP